MVTKEDFDQFIAEFETFRDMMFDSLTKMQMDIEYLQENVKELKKDLDIRRKELGIAQTRLR